MTLDVTEAAVASETGEVTTNSPTATVKHREVQRDELEKVLQAGYVSRCVRSIAFALKVQSLHTILWFDELILSFTRTQRQVEHTKSGET